MLHYYDGVALDSPKGRRRIRWLQNIICTFIASSIQMTALNVDNDAAVVPSVVPRIHPFSVSSFVLCCKCSAQASKSDCHTDSRSGLGILIRTFSDAWSASPSHMRREAKRCSLKMSMSLNPSHQLCAILVEPLVLVTMVTSTPDAAYFWDSGAMLTRISNLSLEWAKMSLLPNAPFASSERFSEGLVYSGSGLSPCSS